MSKGRGISPALTAELLHADEHGALKGIFPSLHTYSRYIFSYGYLTSVTVQVVYRHQWRNYATFPSGIQIEDVRDATDRL